jgi:hypothetical protein
MRSAPGRVMFGASAWSRSVTFPSLAASFSSVAALHCCRSPFSCHTARQRPRSSRAGYTVMPYSSSMTSPPPRVAARPVPFTRTRPGARLAVDRAAGRAALPRAGCGDSVGILKTGDGACVMRVLSLPAFPQAGGLTLAAFRGAPTATRTRDLPLRRRSLYPLSYRGYGNQSLPGIAAACRGEPRGAGRQSG